MAHYARIGTNNIVEEVIVIPNEQEPTEADGIAYCQQLFGGNWLKTSYTASIRKNFAGIGYQYDTFRDAFISPKPYPSWQFVEDICGWQAPTPKPNDGQQYRWDEYSQAWVVLA